MTTSPKNHKTRALAVKETWGRRCDELLFVSSKHEPALPTIEVKCEKEDHDHLWCKNRKGIVQAHKIFKGQYDWFFKADDDTYAVVENLKHLVSAYDPNVPLWFGCPFKYPGGQRQIYPSGGRNSFVKFIYLIIRIRIILHNSIEHFLCQTSFGSQPGKQKVFD